METQEKINLISVILLVLTGILHLIAPLIYGMTFEGMGMLLFGIIYACLGILVQLKSENKIIGILSIIFPLIGAIIGTILLILSFNAFLLFLVILDPIIIVLRIYIYKQL